MAQEKIDPFTKELPTKEFIYPYLMLVLHNRGGSARNTDCEKDLIQWFNLSDDLSAKKAVDGSSLFAGRVHFARLELDWAGYVETVSRGVWGLSQKGKDKIPDLVDLDEKQLDTFRKEVYRLVAEEGKKKKKAKELKKEEEIDGISEEEDEEKKKEEKQKEQLDKIRAMDPFAFERLCKKLFEAVGYEDAVETKQTGDNGIDGFGFFSFGLVRFKVVFQAKRYQEGSNISSDQIHKLHGAMNDDRADKAVFITTSDFTRAGRETARRLGIECINGDRLIGLLKKHKLGYSPVTEHEFDEDFFDKI